MKFIPPIKTLLKGDNAALHIRFAQSQLAILERQMSFQSLNEGRRVVSPYDGVTVECLKSFGRKEIRIHVAGIEAPWAVEQGWPAGRPAVKKLLKSCQCFPFFSLGVIVDVAPEEPTTSQLVDNRFAYDIDICDSKTYSRVMGVYDANFGRYEVGQLVLVTVGSLSVTGTSGPITYSQPSGEPIDCNRDCLLGLPPISLLTVSPIHMMEDMRQITKTLEVD